MFILINAVVRTVMSVVLRLGGYRRMDVDDQCVEALYVQADLAIARIRIGRFVRHVEINGYRRLETNQLLVAVRHGPHVFSSVPPTTTVTFQNYGIVFWRWAHTGDPVLGLLLREWHDAVLGKDELLIQRNLVLCALTKLKDALEPLRGSGPISLPRIYNYVLGLRDGLLNGGWSNHADLIKAVEWPLHLGGRKPGPAARLDPDAPH